MELGEMIRGEDGDIKEDEARKTNKIANRKI